MPRRAIPRHVRDAWKERGIERLRRELDRTTSGPPGAIVFDAYGTLFDVRSVEAACASLTSDAAAFTALWRTKQLEYSWLRSLMGQYADFATVTAEALDYSLARFELSPGAGARQRLLDSWLTLGLYPEVAEALRALASHHLAILSNGSPAMLDAVVRHNGLTNRFASVLSVDPVRAYKPDPRVYAHAADALALPAARVLFVTANAWDAVGAKNFGFRVAWCNRLGLAFDTHGPAPDLKVGSLARLHGALAGLGGEAE